MLKKTLFSIFLLLPTVCTAEKVEVISSIYFNEGEVKPIYLAPGAPTLLSFHCNIIDALKDTGGSIEGAQRENPRNMVVWLKSSASQPATLTIVCEKSVFVFNVIPSKQHQSYIKILGSWGSPGLLDNSKKVLLSSESQSNTDKKDIFNSPKVKKVLFTSERGTK